MKARMSNKAKAIMAIAFALILWAPSGISTTTQPVVTGHSTFYNGDVFDQCLASIAGILRSRVMWFNDMVLTETYAGKGTFLYVTEHGSVDPSEPGTQLYSEGVFYDFVDPNGAQWHVEEAFMTTLRSSIEIGASKVLENTQVEANKQNRTYVWIVELADRPIYDQFAPTNINDPNYHTFYNFLALVDTCKFKHKEVSQNPDVVHDGTELGHPGSTAGHVHEGYTADLWVGKRPNVAPIGAEGLADSVTWQSQWSINEQTP